MVIVIPAAGMGSRVSSYGVPKPLIKVGPELMLGHVLSFLKPLNILAAKYIILLQRQHYITYKINFDDLFKKYLSKNHFEIVLVDGVTEGAASTVLLARRYLELFGGEELIITNSDQYVDWNALDFIQTARGYGYDGTLLTFPNDRNPKWSFSQVDWRGEVLEVVEKELRPGQWVCNVGVYHFKRIKDFLYGVDNMIEENFRVNSEFFIAPVYNYIEGTFKSYLIPAENMIGMGTEEDIEKAKVFFDKKKNKV